MEDDSKSPPPARVPEPVIEPDQVYANTSVLELSVYDLKILFGQIEQHTGRTVVDWHTAVTMPWMHVKILLYWLRLQLSWYEATYGTVKVPDVVRPPVPEMSEDATIVTKEYVESMQKLHVEIFGT